jgi:hypothetical protein
MQTSVVPYRTILLAKWRAKSPFFDRLMTVSAPLRAKLAVLRAWMLLLGGAAIHTVTGHTPKRSYLALVTLFQTSNGRANDILSDAVAHFHRPYDLPPATGVLGELGEADLARIEEKLESDGYVVFENCLTEEFCENVVQQSLKFNFLIRGDETSGAYRTGPFNRAAPTAPLYSLTRDDTTDIPEVQTLMADPSLIAVAQNYLRSKPIFTGIYMGWSTAVKDTPDADAAQSFHWDMERIRWLRFFVYLTDVTPESGPHCFIKGSHRTGAIPKDLLDLSYVRHSDGTIIQRYGQEAYREFTGRRGTIIAEDSRGFHKGKLPTRGDRLLLAFELSNTTFGVNKRHLIRNIHVPRFGEFAKSYPRLYLNLDFTA